MSDYIQVKCRNTSKQKLLSVEYVQTTYLNENKLNIALKGSLHLRHKYHFEHFHEQKAVHLNLSRKKKLPLQHATTVGLYLFFFYLVVCGTLFAFGKHTLK